MYVHGNSRCKPHHLQDTIASPQLTGQWEKRLNAIWMEGENPGAFMDDVRQFVKNMVENFKASNKFSTLQLPQDEIPKPRKYASTATRFEKSTA